MNEMYEYYESGACEGCFCCTVGQCSRGQCPTGAVGAFNEGESICPCTCD